MTAAAPALPEARARSITVGDAIVFMDGGIRVVASHAPHGTGKVQFVAVEPLFVHPEHKCKSRRVVSCGGFCIIGPVAEASDSFWQARRPDPTNHNLTLGSR